MKINLKKLSIIIFSLILILNQTVCHAVYIYSAKSTSLKAQENLSSILLPAFRYNRNNIELNQISQVDLILSPESKTVKVEVISAEGIGLGIDNATLAQKGLKILKPERLRT